MTNKVSTSGAPAGSLTPSTIFQITNGVYSLVGGSNHCTHHAYRVRNWSTTSDWKATLASLGYLPSRAYQDNQGYGKRRMSDGESVFLLRSNKRNGFAIRVPIHVAASSAEIALPGHDPDVLLDAQNKAKEKARNMRINLAVTVAEGRSTFRMITDAVRTLGESYGHFRKGRFKKAARRLGIDDIPRAAANNWLAYSLGWSPLVSDIVGLVELHRDQFSDARKQRFIVRAEKRVVRTGSHKLANHVITNNHGFSYDTDVFVARAGMLLEVTSRVDQFQASVGLSAGDILSTVWELVPWSFVFDYIVNVGQWLGNLNALSGLSVIDAWTCQETSRTSNVLCSDGPGSLYTSNVPDYFVTLRRFNRSPWNAGNMTWPRVRRITDLSAVQLINLAALFAQTFRGDPPLGKFRPNPTE